jgi:hypothetical protein
MRQSTSGPRGGRLAAAFRHVTSMGERRLERRLKQNEEWIAQVRNAPTVEEQMRSSKR